MKKIKVITVVLLIILSSMPVMGYFADIGMDARARGMANAMSARYGDIHSFHYNPAGTCRTKNFELSLMYDKPLTMTDLNDGSEFMSFNFSMLMPFTSSANLSWLIRWLFKALTWGHEDFMFKDGAFGLSFKQQDIAGLVTEQFLSMNYSRQLDDVLFKGAKLAFGFNVDFYIVNINANEDFATLPDSPNDSIFTVGLDLGVIYNFAENFTLGAVFENIIQPDYSVFTDGEDKKPMNVKLAGSIFFNKLLFFENLTLSADYVKYGKYDSDDNTVASTSWHYGFESWWFDNHFAFRGGFQLADNENSEITTGATFMIPFGRHMISIDYAFTLPLGVVGTKHLLALTWKWEQPKWAFEYDKKKIVEMKRLYALQQKAAAQKVADDALKSAADKKATADKKAKDKKKDKKEPKKKIK